MSITNQANGVLTTGTPQRANKKLGHLISTPRIISGSVPTGGGGGGGSDLQQVRQAGQHVGGDGGDVADTLTVFQEDPDQQQDRPEERDTTEHRSRLTALICDHQQLPTR